MGYLTSILSAKEQAFIQVLIAKSDISMTDVWIGMRRAVYPIGVSYLTTGYYCTG